MKRVDLKGFFYSFSNKNGGTKATVSMIHV